MEKPQTPLHPELRAKWEKDLARSHKGAENLEQGLADLVALAEAGGEPALAQIIREQGSSYLKWQADQILTLNRLRDHVLGKDLESVLDADGWSETRAALASSPVEYYVKSYPSFGKMRSDLLQYAADHRWEMIVTEDMLDLYSRDAASHAAIPPAMLTQLAAKLRGIDTNGLVHRMGGPRDPVQGYAEADGDDLLFQLYSDRAMGWMWGDLGALFVYIKPGDLESRRFGRCYAWIDGG